MNRKRKIRGLSFDTNRQQWRVRQPVGLRTHVIWAGKRYHAALWALVFVVQAA